MVGLDWDKQAPEWANALISNDSGSRYYWVEQWGGSCSRFEEWESKRCKYLDEYHQVPSRINMVQPHNWILMAERQADWDGEGNPPVGTVCNMLTFDSRDISVEVLSVGDTRVFVRNINTGEELAPYLEGVTFSVIKTQEQIAAEEREKAIDALHELIVNNPYNAAETLYDKGYRLTKTEE